MPAFGQRVMRPVKDKTEWVYGKVVKRRPEPPALPGLVNKGGRGQRRRLDRDRVGKRGEEGAVWMRV